MLVATGRTPHKTPGQPRATAAEPASLVQAPAGPRRTLWGSGLEAASGCVVSFCWLSSDTGWDLEPTFGPPCVVLPSCSTLSPPGRSGSPGTLTT